LVTISSPLLLAPISSCITAAFLTLSSQVGFNEEEEQREEEEEEEEEEEDTKNRRCAGR
jgi:ribosomal protein L12E/L44/L45/RPP1/RPP2